MNYRVEVTATAKAEAEAAYTWLEARTQIHCVEWFNGLVDAVEALATHPARWPRAPEVADAREDIRQMIYGKTPHAYRILFIIRGSVVYVLHIRHGARQTIAPADIAWPD